MSGASDITFYVPLAWVADTVSVSIVGIYAGDYVVASGGVVSVPYGADSGGLLTATYLYALYEAGTAAYGPFLSKFSVYIDDADTTIFLPVVIGRKYTSTLQLVPPDQEAQSRSPGGPGPAKTRRLHMVGARCATTIYGTASLGTYSDHMHAINPTTAGGTPIASATLWNGMWWDTIDDDYSRDGGQIMASIADPYPFTVVSLSGFFRIADR